MIHLTIDGIPVEVEKGTTILAAAKKIGGKIPTLCYLEDQILPDLCCGNDRGRQNLGGYRLYRPVLRGHGG